jgi:hypothetical protein
MINLEGFVRKHKTINIGGKDWVFSELTIADFAKFRAEVVEKKEKNKDKRRQRLIAEAEKIGGVDPLKLLEKLDAPVTDNEIEAEMDTIEGMGYLMFLSLKYHYPEISKEEAMSLIGISNIEEIASVIVPFESKKKQSPAKKETGQQQ